MAIAEVIAGIISGVGNIVFSALKMAGIGDTEGDRADRYYAATVYLDRNVLRDKVEAIIFMLDVDRNIKRIRASLRSKDPRAIHAWETQHHINPATQKPKGLLELETLPRATVESAMVSYNSLQSPNPSKSGKILIRDDGYYPPQGKYILPSLLQSDGGGFIAQITGSDGYISVYEFLMATVDGQRAYASHLRQQAKADRFYRDNPARQIAKEHNGREHMEWTLTDSAHAFKFSRYTGEA